MSDRDREAAARRVADEIMSRKFTGGAFVYGGPRSRQEFRDALAAALLAFPGGDAESVAWRLTWMVLGKPQHEYTDNTYRAKNNNAETVTPLYAAPGAGEAGALRKALERIGQLCIDHANQPPDLPGLIRDTKMIVDAALAPGGRPVADAGFTCAFCGRMYDGPQPVAEFCTKRPGDGKCLPGRPS